MPEIGKVFRANLALFTILEAKDYSRSSLKVVAVIIHILCITKGGAP